MEDVVRATKEELEVLSVTGKKKMARSKLHFLYKFTYWREFFPIDDISVLRYLKDMCKEMHILCLHLGIPSHVLDALEANFPSDLDQRMQELVKEWLNSSQDPPCWWHLIQALIKLNHEALAEEIKLQHCKSKAYSTSNALFIAYYYTCRCPCSIASKATGPTE